MMTVTFFMRLRDTVQSSLFRAHPILSQSEKTPTSKVVSKNKLVSVGVQSPTEIKRSARMRRDSERKMSAKLTRIPRQDSRGES